MKNVHPSRPTTGGGALSPLLVLLILSGCYPEKKQSPTSGTLAVRIAESVAPPVIRQIDAFHDLYAERGAEIRYEVVTSLDAVLGFVQDTFQLAVCVDSLTADEYRTVDEMDGSFLVRTAAFDGIVLVTHPGNSVETISTTQVRDILSGKLTRWKELDAAGPRGTISVVLQASSDISRYLERKVLGGSTIAVQIEKAITSKDVLNRVRDNERAIGFAGLAWVDSGAADLGQLSVLMDHGEDEAWYAVAEEARGVPYSPHPANILRGYYPFSRRVYLLSRAALGGDLATGFGAYILGSSGQKIFFKAGMIPATQTIRLQR